MFNLFDLVLLFSFLAICGSFWQWRQQDEAARNYAQQLCKRHELQLLDIARKTGRPSWQKGPGWLAEFQFGFSSDGEMRYEGSIDLFNLRLKESYIPPHRTPTELPEPRSNGCAQPYMNMSYGKRPQEPNND